MKVTGFPAELLFVGEHLGGWCSLDCSSLGAQAPGPASLSPPQPSIPARAPPLLPTTPSQTPKTSPTMRCR